MIRTILCAVPRKNRGEDAHTDGRFNLKSEGLHGDHEAVHDKG